MASSRPSVKSLSLTEFSKISFISSVYLQFTIYNFSFGLINRTFILKRFAFCICYVLFIYPLRHFKLVSFEYFHVKNQMFPTCFGLSLKIYLAAFVLNFLLILLCLLWKISLFCVLFKLPIILLPKMSGNVLLKI